CERGCVLEEWIRSLHVGKDFHPPFRKDLGCVEKDDLTPYFVGLRFDGVGGNTIDDDGVALNSAGRRGGCPAERFKVEWACRWAEQVTVGSPPTPAVRNRERLKTHILDAIAAELCRSPLRGAVIGGRTCQAPTEAVGEFT